MIVMKMTPTPRFYRIAACAASLALASTARAVVFHSTGDPTFNTTAPTGTLANSGWQYQVDVAGTFLGTAVGPHHFLTAAHIGGTGTVYQNGTPYQATFVQDYGDLRLLRVDNTFHSYAPLYESTDGNEVGREIVVIGRGTRRGTVNTAGGVTRGWNWGADDYVRRWGENKIAGTANGGSLLRFDFNLSGVNNTGENEAVLTPGDSGGAIFIDVDGQWKVAGINYSVSGPYSVGATGAKFHGALYDVNGLYDHSTGVPVPASGASGAYASRVSPNVASIKSHLQLPPTWTTNGNGNWGTAANWANGGVPNAIGATADFRTVITAPRNVTYSGTVTAGTLNFDSAHGYTIQPNVASSQLHLNVASGSAAINVASGDHGVTGLHLNDPTVFNVIDPSSTLTVQIASTAAQPITKQGAGKVIVNRLVGGPVTVARGTLAISAGASTSVTTSKVTGLSVDSGGGARLDLTNKNMVVANTPVGGKSGSTYTGLTGLLAQSYAEGAWTGPGITSSTAGGSSLLTTLAIARAGDALGVADGATTTWSGQTVGADDALIAYTYGGDTNLDGKLDADDYGTIDFAVLTPGASGYYNGDFNYDGVINADDYGVIDFNILAQDEVLISSASQPAALTGVSAVPEPGSLSLVALASAAFLSRRRRRRAR